MKKFLTVLLALSVVFTYTVGTAFALPSDGTQTAGLTQAKAEAVAELDDFDYSVYTDAGQTIVKGYIAEAKTDIEKATSSTGVSNAMTNFMSKVDNIASYLKDVVADAVREAKTQVKDYLYLFGLDYDELLKCSTTILPAAIESKGNIKLDSLALDDEEAFITDFKKAVARYTAAASVADVQEQMNDALRVIDKYMAKLSTVDLPAERKNALVQEMVSYAGAVSTAKGYSKNIVDKYNQVVDEGIAAAKAAQTWNDYYQIINKYFGTGYIGKTTYTYGTSNFQIKCVTKVNSATLYPTPYQNGVVVDYNGVHIIEKTPGELNILKGMTIAVEKQVSAVKKALAIIGDYNYKDVVIKQWANAEEALYELNTFAETGDWDTFTNGNAFYDLVDRIGANSDPSDINTCAADIAAEYGNYTKLAAAKKSAISTIRYFYGYNIQGKAVGKIGNFDPDEQKQIANLQQLYTNSISEAATIADVEKLVNDYKAKVDTYQTTSDKQTASISATLNDGIDQYVADKVAKIALTADQKALVDRLIEDLKASIAYAREDVAGKSVTASAKIGSLNVTPNGTVSLDALFATQKVGSADQYTVILDFKNQPRKFGYDINISGTARANYSQNDYSSVNWQKIKVAEAELNAAKTTATTWTEYFAVYDAQVKACDDLDTLDIAAYKAAVADLEDAISKLGTVENTAAFKVRLADAKAAETALNTALNSVTSLTDKEKAELAGASNISVLEDAEYELEYLKYLEANGGVPQDSAKVIAAKEIIVGMTSGNILAYYPADKKAILETATKAMDDLFAAKTTSEKEAIAEKVIADMRAFAPSVADNSDYTEALADNKAEAVKYFNKYYNATFASDAVSAAALIKDIIEFNEKLLPDPSADALKEAVYGTHVKIGSSAAKGYIKISWNQNDNGVILDGYEVYRSTKKTTGFKKISTFKVQKSKKYTTGLKKGTKYYYYVKGYKMVGDEKVYTHKSITVARTFR